MPAFDSTFDFAFDSGPAGGEHASLPIKVRLWPVAEVSLPLVTRKFPADILSGKKTASMGEGYSTAVWRPVVTIGGVDMSNFVLGQIEVMAEEGAARVADFRVLLAAGTSVYLPGWVGQLVTIDFAGADENNAPVFPMRLFTGVIDTPAFDVKTGVVSVSATDDLQGVCARMLSGDIDQLVGGQWSPAVFDKASSIERVRIFV